MKEKLNKGNEITDRRSMIGRSGAAIGALLLSSSYTRAKSETNNEKDRELFFDVRKYGATGKRRDNATKSFRDTIEACVSEGGGIVNVPPGEYTVGTVELKDNVTLNIEAGATLFLSQSKSDFKPAEESTMIFAENAKNIAITGRGTLDGLAQYDYKEMNGIDPDISKEIEMARAAGVDMRRYYRKRSAMNTFMFVLNNCTNVLLSDISVIHSPLWNIRLNDCDRVHVRGINIFSDLEKGVNADGIDIVSSSNVTISDSIIVTGDDSIVLKTISRDGKPANPCENITVTNCILTSSSTALMIGTETEADIRHVLFTNCAIRNSNKGFGINMQDGATVSDIIFSNLTIDTNRRHWNWWGDAEMCKFILIKRKKNSKLGIIKDIVVDNVIAQVRGTSTISGHEDQPLENIRISNVQVFMNAENAKDKRATHAMKIENVSELKIRDLSVKWSANQVEEKWQSALVLKKVSDFQIESFSGRQGLISADNPVIAMENVSDGIIRDSRATEGANIFASLSGNESKGIELKNNNVRKAKKDIVFGDDALKKEVDIN
jgi:polygalacturonase